MARAFEPGRRRFLGVAAAALLVPRRLLAADPSAPPSSLPPATTTALETSPFAYISPLKKDGAESTCHGELWFGWIDGAVVINTRRGTWKARALGQGLDRARIWVGSYGRWKGILPGGATNEEFRGGPSFVAQARFETDKALNDRLLALYAKKYGSDFEHWHEDMMTGFFSGQRKLIRYTPT